MNSGWTPNPDRTEPFTEQFLNELDTAVTKVTSQITDVALAGPTDVRNVAREIQRAANESIESAARLFIIRQRSPEARSSRREIDNEYATYHKGRFDLQDTLATFTEAAAKALDDAGVDP
ncbi:hypothetical protein ABZ488_18045 [Streptomyces griseus]|uniref:hypothetical protein n=1 Tax=Streptomyces griseus TaxID=1911 RepID=UPI0033CFCDB8